MQNKIIDFGKVNQRQNIYGKEEEKATIQFINCKRLM